MSESQAFALLADPNKVEVSTGNDTNGSQTEKPSTVEQKTLPKKEESNSILNLLDETTEGPFKKKEEGSSNGSGSGTSDSSSSPKEDSKKDSGSGTLDLSDVEIHNDAPEPVVQLTPEQIREKKERILYDIERLRRRGVRFPRSFTMASDLNEMEAEYNRIKKDLETEQGIRFQRKMLMTCVSGIEMLNSRFDPFDVQLDGWSESVNENIGDYDDVFEELYEKYRGTGKMAPELRLLFMLGGSALMFHMTKSMFSSATPQMGDILRQNPNLAAQMQQAAAQSMGGGGGGASGLMNMMGMAQSGVSGSPPPPVPPRGVSVPPPENVDDVLNDLQGSSKKSGKKSRSGGGWRGGGKSSIDTLSLSLQN